MILSIPQFKRVEGNHAHTDDFVSFCYGFSEDGRREEKSWRIQKGKGSSMGSKKGQ